MNRTIALCTLVLIALLALTACGDETPTPGATVRTLFAATTAGELADQFCDPALGNLMFPTTTPPTSYQFADLQYGEPETNDQQARVVVRGTLESPGPDSPTAPIRWQVDLQHTQGRWCITAITRLSVD